jgi:hypothetical protein
MTAMMLGPRSRLIQPDIERRPARRAHRRRRMELREPRPARRQPVDIRSPHRAVAVTAQFIPEIVADNPNDIRTVVLGPRSNERREPGGSQKKSATVNHRLRVPLTQSIYPRNSTRQRGGLLSDGDFDHNVTAWLGPIDRRHYFPNHALDHSPAVPTEHNHSDFPALEILLVSKPVIRRQQYFKAGIFRARSKSPFARVSHPC